MSDLLNRIELRGWKDICKLMGVSRWTAKKILKQRGLLNYENGTPVLNIETYRLVSLKNQMADRVTKLKTKEKKNV